MKLIVREKVTSIDLNDKVMSPNVTIERLFRTTVALRRSRSNHNFTRSNLTVKRCNCNQFNYSFFVRIVREWNDLPANVVEAGHIILFKKALKSFLHILQSKC